LLVEEVADVIEVDALADGDAVDLGVDAAGPAELAEPLVGAAVVDGVAPWLEGVVGGGRAEGGVAGIAVYVAVVEVVAELMGVAEAGLGALAADLDVVGAAVGEVAVLAQGALAAGLQEREAGGVGGELGAAVEAVDDVFGVLDGLGALVRCGDGGAGLEAAAAAAGLGAFVHLLGDVAAGFLSDGFDVAADLDALDGGRRGGRWRCRREGGLGRPRRRRWFGFDRRRRRRGRR
jgi:hypothetical protein